MEQNSSIVGHSIGKTPLSIYLVVSFRLRRHRCLSPVYIDARPYGMPKTGQQTGNQIPISDIAILQTKSSLPQPQTMHTLLVPIANRKSTRFYEIEKFHTLYSLYPKPVSMLQCSTPSYYTIFSCFLFKFPVYYIRIFAFSSLPQNGN